MQRGGQQPVRQEQAATVQGEQHEQSMVTDSEHEIDLCCDRDWDELWYGQRHSIENEYDEDWAAMDAKTAVVEPAAGQAGIERSSEEHNAGTDNVERSWADITERALGDERVDDGDEAKLALQARWVAAQGEHRRGVDEEDDEKSGKA